MYAGGTQPKSSLMQSRPSAHGRVWLTFHVFLLISELLESSPQPYTEVHLLGDSKSIVVDKDGPSDNTRGNTQRMDGLTSSAHELHCGRPLAPSHIESHP